jgi:hypothetical protein
MQTSSSYYLAAIDPGTMHGKIKLNTERMQGVLQYF